ncbi:MAG: phosphosugar isomerase, partial [Dermatophilaceae bacterium]
MPQLDESLLDDEGRIVDLDSRGSLRALATAGAQVREAQRLADEAGIAAFARGDRPRSVLV